MDPHVKQVFSLKTRGQKALKEALVVAANPKDL
jgi:hypothetical protein